MNKQSALGLLEEISGYLISHKWEKYEHALQKPPRPTVYAMAEITYRLISNRANSTEFKSAVTELKQMRSAWYKFLGKKLDNPV